MAVSTGGYRNRLVCTGQLKASLPDSRHAAGMNEARPQLRHVFQEYPGSGQ